MRQDLWDDVAFKNWVADGARAKGMTIAEALTAVGASRFYFKRRNTEGRSINVILNLAELLDQSPARLLHMPDHTAELDELLRLWRKMSRNFAPSAMTAEREFTEPDNGDDDDEDDPFAADKRLQRIVVAARIIATQLASLVYVASDRADTDPAILMELALREFHKVSNTRSPDSAAPRYTSANKRRRRAEPNEPKTPNQPETANKVDKAAQERPEPAATETIPEAQTPAEQSGLVHRSRRA